MTKVLLYIFVLVVVSTIVFGIGHSVIGIIFNWYVDR